MAKNSADELKLRAFGGATLAAGGQWNAQLHDGARPQAVRLAGPGLLGWSRWRQHWFQQLIAWLLDQVSECLVA